MYINIFKKRWIDWPRRLCPTLCCLALSPGPCLPQFSMTWMNSMDQKIMSWSCFSCLFRLKGYFLSICCEFCLVRVRSVKREFLFDFMQNRRRQNMRKGNDITTDECTKKHQWHSVSWECGIKHNARDGRGSYFFHGAVLKKWLFAPKVLFNRLPTTYDSHPNPT